MRMAVMLTMVLLSCCSADEAPELLWVECGPVLAPDAEALPRCHLQECCYTFAVLWNEPERRECLIESDAGERWSCGLMCGPEDLERPQEVCHYGPWEQQGGKAGP